MKGVREWAEWREWQRWREGERGAINYTRLQCATMRLQAAIGAIDGKKGEVQRMITMGKKKLQFVIIAQI